MAHHGAALRSITGDEGLVEKILEFGSGGDLPVGLRVILAFAEKLTLQPEEVEAGDLEPLRAAGLDDRGILEVVEVTAYFNFVTRLANGLGVALETEHPRPEANQGDGVSRTPEESASSRRMSP